MIGGVNVSIDGNIFPAEMDEGNILSVTQDGDLCLLDKDLANEIYGMYVYLLNNSRTDPYSFATYSMSSHTSYSIIKHGMEMSLYPLFGNNDAGRCHL